jgi:hypothetical protein
MFHHHDETTQSVSSTYKNDASAFMSVLSMKHEKVTNKRIEHSGLSDEEIVANMRRLVSSIDCKDEESFMDWIAMATVMIDRGGFPAGLPVFVNSKPKTKNGKKEYSEEDLRKANAKKLLDMYFVFAKFPYLLEDNGEMDLLIDRNKGEISFNFQVGISLCSHSVKSLVGAISPPKHAQLFYLSSVKSIDVVEENERVRNTLTRLRKRAMAWVSQSRRNQSNDGRSVAEQVSDLLLVCRALLATEGRLQAAADLVEDATGEKRGRGVIATTKKRIERILNVKDGDFWAYRSIKLEDEEFFDDEEESEEDVSEAA